MKSHSSFLSQSLKVSFLGCDLDVTNVKENAPKKFEELGMTSPNQVRFQKICQVFVRQAQTP